jgi:hypothetical protein
MPDPVSDDHTAMDHIPLSQCSTGPEPEMESFTDVLVTNDDPVTRDTTSTSKRERGYLDRSQLWLSLYLFGHRSRNHGLLSGQVIACCSLTLSFSRAPAIILCTVYFATFLLCVTLPLCKQHTYSFLLIYQGLGHCCVFRVLLI